MCLKKEPDSFEMLATVLETLAKVPNNPPLGKKPETQGGHVRERLKAKTEHKPRDTGQKHLTLLAEHTEAIYKSTVNCLSVLLEKQKTTYDMLWALFITNAEVDTNRPGTGAPRCVANNKQREPTVRVVS